MVSKNVESKIGDAIDINTEYPDRFTLALMPKLAGDIGILERFKKRT